MDSAHDSSELEELELKERIKMLKDEEKALRHERQVLESKLRNLILERYMKLMKKYGYSNDEAETHRKTG